MFPREKVIQVTGRVFFASDYLQIDDAIAIASVLHNRMTVKYSSMLPSDGLSSLSMSPSSVGGATLREFVGRCR
jgi:hypothetical protein